jgi:glutamate--cysteine ligase
MRNGVCGYRNKEDLRLNFDTLEAFQKSMAKRIQEGVLQSERENYASVRIKLKTTPSSPNKKQGDLSHLEIRLLDLNPFVKSGIDHRHAEIIHQFLIFCLLKPENSRLDETQQIRGFENHERAATFSLSPEAQIIDDTGENIPMQQALEDIFEEMQSTLTPLLPPIYQESALLLKQLVYSPSSRPAARNLEHIKQHSYLKWSVSQAKAFLKKSQQSAFTFHGLEDMELSTQLLLRQAVVRGVEIEILDRAENFVRLTLGNHTEYVQQATRTSLDPYVSVLMMENKVVTKKILHTAGIRVPEGSEYHHPNDAHAAFPYFQGKSIVIKPKSTNFGLGITILKTNNDATRFQQAVDIAFKHDTTVLIESFVSGKEYRIFLIHGKVVGILHRVPANVTGDGSSTIAELIHQKNTDPLRGSGYRKPLEKIALGEEESMFLEMQGLNFETVPANGKTVYLRENSNISTGGDSLDFTDDVHDSYKQIAIQAAHALRVNITGLDMMIDDITQPATDDNYAIIEMNFNPAIHIHCHPFQGKNRHLDKKILDALFGENTLPECNNRHPNKKSN